MVDLGPILFRTALLALLTPISFTGLAQLHSGASGVRGGGLLQTCDTSMHVSFTTQLGSNYACQFQSVVVPGSTLVQGLGWNYLYGGSIAAYYGPSLQVYYPDQSEYPVCLTVDAFDLNAQQPCSTTVCDLITPLPDPTCADLVADFTISGVSGQTITFADLSSFSGSIAQSIWSFGDGTAATPGTATHTFFGTGPFEVCLTVTGPPPLNCTTTLCQWLYLGSGNVSCPLLVDHGFILLQAQGLVGVLDTSLTSGMYSRVDWDFGDGAMAVGPVAVHAYSEPGVYPVCGTLRVWGPLLADTCTTNLCRTVYASFTTGIETAAGSSTLALHPNPFLDALQVSTSNGSAGLIEVVDPRGRVVHRSSALFMNNRTVLDLGHLEAGAYTVVVTADGRRQSARAMKVR